MKSVLAERCSGGPCVRSHLPVHQQPVAGLEGLDRVQRYRPEVAVGGDAERALQRGHRRPPVVQADDDLSSNRGSAAGRGQTRPAVGADLAVDQNPWEPQRVVTAGVRGLTPLYQGGAPCTQRPASIVATTCAVGDAVGVGDDVGVEHDQVGRVAGQQQAAAAVLADGVGGAGGEAEDGVGHVQPLVGIPRLARRRCGGRPRGCRPAGRARRSARPSRTPGGRRSRAGRASGRRRPPARPRARSARSRSTARVDGCIEAVTPIAAKRAQVGVVDALARARSAAGPAAPPTASRVGLEARRAPPGWRRRRSRARRPRGRDAAASRGDRPPARRPTSAHRPSRRASRPSTTRACRP